MKSAMFVSFALLLAGCATAPTPAEKASEPKIAASAEPVRKGEVLPEPYVVYYTGKVNMLSGDGKEALGNKPTAVKREVNPSEGTIIETVLDEGELRVTTLTQRSGNMFDATDEAGTFTGTIMFGPTPWKPMNWAYDLEMADGSGKIEGSATVMPNGLTTMKAFIGPNGEKQMQIIDKLTVVTEEEYEAAIAQ